MASVALPKNRLPANIFPNVYQEIQERKAELSLLQDPLYRARASKMSATIGLIVGMLVGLAVFICLQPSLQLVFFGTLGFGVAGALVAIPIPQLIIHRKIKRLEKESLDDSTVLNRDELFVLFQQQNVIETVENFNKTIQNLSQDSTQIKYFNLPTMENLK